MSARPPPVLVRLLAAPDPASQDQAWDSFLQAYSRLLVSTARKFGGGYDGAMDRYAYILEQLRRDDFRRLRGYAVDRRSTFTTWLVVVARRLCLDYRRRRHGRPRGNPGGLVEVERGLRQRLADFISEDLDMVGEVTTDEPDPEIGMRTRELRGALSCALQDLPSRDRLLLAFRYEQGMRAPEIARIMAFPSVFHVYRRLNSVQQSLREVLEEMGVSSASP